MNFQQLEYALAVDQHKHFGKAAKSRHVTQATLSAMIKKLEEELGYTLFDRSRYPIQTTDIGHLFINRASKILADRNELLQLGNEITTEITGQLTIGIIPTVANSLLPIILPTILEQNPKLQLTITEITTEEIGQQLVTDKIDMGILATPLDNDTLEETILYYEQMMVYGVKESSKEFVNSKDIKEGKIWLLEEGHCFRNQAMTICHMQEKDVAASNLHFEGGSFDTLLHLTDQFGGYTLVPELYYHNMSDDNKKTTKPFQKPIPVREISLVSYRPYAKKQSVEYLSKLIQKLVKGHLSTSNYKNQDLEIIGI